MKTDIEKTHISGLLKIDVSIHEKGGKQLVKRILTIFFARNLWQSI